VVVTRKDHSLALDLSKLTVAVGKVADLAHSHASLVANRGADEKAVQAQISQLYGSKQSLLDSVKEDDGRPQVPRRCV
jgi:hypothetical protein